MVSIAESLIEAGLDINQHVVINAPVERAFDSLLAIMGPKNEMMDGTPMPLVVEPWPGGRWFRDLGDDNGHFWGHVQVIKRPTLLEVVGPMFMSYPVASHIQYRLTEEGGATRLSLRHQAFGLIDPSVQEGVVPGWKYLLDRIRVEAEN